MKGYLTFAVFLQKVTRELQDKSVVLCGVRVELMSNGLLPIYSVDDRVISHTEFMTLAKDEYESLSTMQRAL